MTQRDIYAYALVAVRGYRSDTFSFRTGAASEANDTHRRSGSAGVTYHAARRVLVQASFRPEIHALQQQKAAIAACTFLTPASMVRLDWST